MSEKHKQNSDISKREEKILAFWNKNDIFKKSEKKDAPRGEFVFYDGPPFATGLPHFGHILAGTIKDAIPRYKTMQGFRVRRKWGWDCHGLPLENEIEKELNLGTKRDIENYGIEKFNKKARDSVLRYEDDWKRIVPRMGRWVDMERDYKTMDTTYTESVWWVFKTLYNKKLIYKGFKSMHLCPRCETTLSNFEVSQGYKDITDFAVTVKLELKDEPKTYLLVWTTTAWTLPGNMAAAVHKDKTYIKVLMDKERLIVAKDRVEILGSEYKILEEFSGSKLLGKEYKPPFNYYKNAKFPGKKNAWKIYHAPYVKMDEGTGLVHIAPAFGQEDMELAQKNEIPLVHHVGTDGKFTKEVENFAGLLVKPKENHQKTDIEIIKYLAHKGLLFAKEKIIHPYPFCWRCDTPLLNYAASSWFVKVTALKNKLVLENKNIRWVPKEIGTRRFHKLLGGAPDWAISRSRYWGAPLPVWRNERTGEIEIIGSIKELRKRTISSKNKYFIVRHGESESNVKGIISSLVENQHKLTKKGKNEALFAARSLDNKIDYIIVSPLLRTKETAEIIAKEIGLPKSAVLEDKRIAEINLGKLNNKPVSEYRKFASTYEDKFVKTPDGGENFSEMKIRIGKFLYDIENKYKEKNILIVTHEYVAWLLTAVSEGADIARTIDIRGKEDDYIRTGEVKELFFVPLPHNSNYEIDLHRPSIDKVTLLGNDGGKLKRIEEVFDCWFESGSMPYGQFHYPFENLDQFNPRPGLFRRVRGYPADFIAEGIDQTRGWFYSLIVLGTALFGKSPYKNVIVNGTILAEDGQKMSKRLKNYPDPMDVVHTYGADSLRYYLLSSSIMRGEDLHFSEQGVGDVMRKIIMRLSNIHLFYALYADKHQDGNPDSAHILDRWILSRLNQLIVEVTEAMEKYELDRATRPIAVFTDDFSTWYLRRSRNRFKGDDQNDKQQALETTAFIFFELSKIMAPFMPFFAEELYQQVKRAQAGSVESVHLEQWPTADEIDEDVLVDMHEVRSVVSSVLELRDEAGIKVRQPLKKLRVKVSKTEMKTIVRKRIYDYKAVYDIINMFMYEANWKGMILIEDTPFVPIKGVKGVQFSLTAIRSLSEFVGIVKG
ncbi:class I tRNA ligase family protein, partial [Patescibacteria group bacterium]|nr:class I tRNA ligase family protein [Patescibacteria group bacterium]